MELCTGSTDRREGAKYLQTQQRQPRKHDPKEKAKQRRVYLHSTGCKRQSGEQKVLSLAVLFYPCSKTEHFVSSS